MKPIAIAIDFAPRTLRRALARTRTTTWLCGSIGLLLCASAAITALEVIQQQNTAKTSLQRVQAKLAARTAGKAAPARFSIPETQADAVNSAILQLNIPWSAALNAIESATPPSIALLALEPDAKKHLLEGLAEANSSDGMIAYIEQLKQQPFFVAVVLTKHEINDKDPNRPLRFQFEAQFSKDGE